MEDILKQDNIADYMPTTYTSINGTGSVPSCVIPDISKTQELVSNVVVGNLHHNGDKQPAHEIEKEEFFPMNGMAHARQNELGLCR